jgi:hypothetical protein
MLAEVSRPAGPTSGYVAHGVSTTTQHGSYIGGSASKPTWSPVGGLVAYSSLRPGRFSVVVVSPKAAKWEAVCSRGRPT